MVLLTQLAMINAFYKAFIELKMQNSVPMQIFAKTYVFCCDFGNMRQKVFLSPISNKPTSATLF